MINRTLFVGSAMAAAIAADPEAWMPEVRRQGFDEVRETESMPHPTGKREPIYMTNVRISKVAGTDSIFREGKRAATAVAENAADAVFEAGGAPRAQLEAARTASGNKRLAYLPHTGLKQRAKALARASKA